MSSIGHFVLLVSVVVMFLFLFLFLILLSHFLWGAGAEVGGRGRGRRVCQLKPFGGRRGIFVQGQLLYELRCNCNCTCIVAGVALASLVFVELALL